MAHVEENPFALKMPINFFSIGQTSYKSTKYRNERDLITGGGGGGGDQKLSAIQLEIAHSLRKKPIFASFEYLVESHRLCCLRKRASSTQLVQTFAA